MIVLRPVETILEFLTDPAFHEVGYLRASWNDKDNPAAMAEFLIDEGATTSAVIVDASSLIFDGVPVGVVLGESFVETFEALGGANLAFVAMDDDPDLAEMEAALDAVILAWRARCAVLPGLRSLGLRHRFRGAESKGPR
jgi:hypothetical protein